MFVENSERGFAGNPYSEAIFQGSLSLQAGQILRCFCLSGAGANYVSWKWTSIVHLSWGEVYRLGTSRNREVVLLLAGHYF